MEERRFQRRVGNELEPGFQSQWQSLKAISYAALDAALEGPLFHGNPNLLKNTD